MLQIFNLFHCFKSRVKHFFNRNVSLGNNRARFLRKLGFERIKPVQRRCKIASDSQTPSFDSSLHSAKVRRSVMYERIASVRIAA